MSNETETATPHAPAETADLSVVLYADGQQVASTFDATLWSEVMGRIVAEVSAREAAQP